MERAQTVRRLPDSLDQLTRLGSLGGATGAVLCEDEDGRRFVAKRGASPGHLREEVTANEIYRVAGVLVSRQRLYEGSRPVRLAEYLEGRLFCSLDTDERGFVCEKLCEHFVTDALVANWDVVGTRKDNIILTPEGEVYRLDNGGALRYRAQGARKKSRKFGRVVEELTSMRQRAYVAGAVFSRLSDEEVAHQIRELVESRESILAVTPDDLREVLAARLDYMEDMLPRLSLARISKKTS